jgi:hypothetical protein
VDLDTVVMHWDHYQPLSKGGLRCPTVPGQGIQ